MKKDSPPERKPVPEPPDRAERERRLAEALRANLRKRKEQARAREADRRKP